MASLSALGELSEIGRTAEPVIREYVLKDASSEFREVLIHQLDAGGKMLRPALVILACEAAGGSRQEAIKAAAAMELVHNYSLIFDDIIDRGDIRRGRPTTRKVFGDSMALLAALHYREAIAQVVNDSPQSAALHRLVSEAIEDLVEGERMDILYEQAGRQEEYVERARMREPSWETYERIVIHKTASLMRACAEAGAIIAEASDKVRRNLGDYAQLAGEAFQIADDTLDIFGEEAKLGKKVGKDIAEHKLGNATILLALDELDAKGKAKLLSILRNERVSQDDVDQAIKLMGSTGCREKALKIAEERIGLAKKALSALPDSDAKTELIALAESFVSRQF